MILTNHARPFVVGQYRFLGLIVVGEQGDRLDVRFGNVAKGAFKIRQDIPTLHEPLLL